jgi:hypothetical protein
MRRSSFFARPDVLMSITWLLTLLLYNFGPLSYHRILDNLTLFVAFGGVALFVFGVWCAQGVDYRPKAPIPIGRIERVITFSALAGLAGIGLMGFDKLLLSGLDYSDGLAAVRFQRAREISSGIDIERSVFLYFGYVTFSFSYVAIVLFLLRAENVHRTTAWMAQLSVFPPIAYALLYGGRSPILLLCFLIVGAGLARRVEGRAVFPPAHRISLKFAFLCIAFFAYVNLTWEDRRQYSNISTYEQFVKVASESWGLSPKAWIEDAVAEETLSSSSAMDLMSAIMYLSHGIVTLDKMIEGHDQLSTYWGLYQIGILAPIVRRVSTNSDPFERMTTELQSINSHGFFPTAWGAWFMDFGLIGGIISVACWGFFCGLTFRMVRLGRGLIPQLMFAFGVMSILISPLNAPFGVANSSLIFLSLIGGAIMLRTRFQGRIRSNDNVPTSHKSDSNTFVKS